MYWSEFLPVLNLQKRVDLYRTPDYPSSVRCFFGVQGGKKSSQPILGCFVENANYIVEIGSLHLITELVTRIEGLGE